MWTAQSSFLILSTLPSAGESSKCTVEDLNKRHPRFQELLSKYNLPGIALAAPGSDAAQAIPDPKPRGQFVELTFVSGERTLQKRLPGGWRARLVKDNDFHSFLRPAVLDP